MAIRRIVFAFCLWLVFLPVFLSADEREDFNLLVRFFREKNFAMVKNIAKDLLENNTYRYHVKVILSEIYFQENDFFYSKELLKELLREYPDKSNEIKKRLEKIEKEEQFISRKSSASSKRFVIYWKDGKQKDEALVDKIHNMIDEAYFSAGRFFGWYPEEIVQLILYYGREYSDFTVFPVWSQGGYDGKLRLMINRGIPDKVLKELIFHEYTHLVIQGVTKGRCPLWFNEAVAQYFSRKYGNGEAINYEVTDFSYDTFPKNWSSLSEEEVKKLYKGSLMVLLSIIQKSDDSVISATLDEIGKGESFETAINSAISVYGLKIQDFLDKGRGK